MLITQEVEFLGLVGGKGRIQNKLCYTNTDKEPGLSLLVVRWICCSFVLRTIFFGKKSPMKEVFVDLVSLKEPRDIIILT